MVIKPLLVEEVIELIELSLTPGTYQGIGNGYEVEFSIDTRNYIAYLDKPIRGIDVPATIVVGETGQVDSITI